MLHNIYPTMKHLFQWKIKDTDKCSHCNLTETLTHAVFECDIAKDAFKKVGSICTELYLDGQGNVDKLNLNIDAVLFGVCNVTHVPTLTLGLTWEQRGNIDKFIILTKQKLILQREEKHIIEIDALKRLFSDYINMQNYNNKKYRKNL